MSIDADIVLGEGEGQTHCHLQLQFHHVESGNTFSNRVFDLQAGIHLEEVMPARLVEQKLYCAGIMIADGPAKHQSITGQLGTLLLR